MIGRTIAHYKIVKKIGEGGMGVVYRAEDIKLKREVAIKFLPRQISSSQEQRERFEIEAQAAASLNHANIATIYSVEELEDETFIVMEYVKGQELKHRIESGPLSTSDTIKITAQIAQGLQAAHEKGVVHRDIKSSNIMLTPNGDVKIMDFGIAKLSSQTKLTKPGEMLGTASYMSPEQARGNEVDQRSDIFSLGVLVFEMLSGRLPFEGEYDQAVIYAILNERPRPITTIRPGIPKELERFVNKCLAKKAENRYQSVDEFLIDLRMLQKKLVSSEDSRQPRTKHGVRLYLGITVLLALLIVGGLYFLQGSDSEEINSSTRAVKRVAVLPFTNIRNDPEIDFLGFALADQIIGGLTYVKNVLVRPSSAVRQYQNQFVDPPDVGEDLNADFVLTGNYLKEGDVIRLNVELVNVQDNEMIWREGLEVEYESAFKLQDIVAEKVTDGLKIQFSQDERERITADTPQNPLAYEYYLRGKSYPNTIQGYELAIEMLKKSIQLDSSYAPVFDELGYRRYRLATFSFAGMEEIEKAKQAYERALSLNSELLSALSKLAILYTEIGKIDESVKLLRRAIRINPNTSYTHFSLSHAYRYAGMLDESRQEAEKALELDPNNPRFRSIAATYFYLGEYQEAFEACDLDKGSTWSTSWKGAALFRQGQNELAVEYFDRAIAMEPSGLFGLWTAGMKGFIQGDIESGLSATRKWEEAMQFDGEGWYHIANNYALLGDKTGCIRALQKAIEQGFFNHQFMLTDSFLDSVRDDPEFRAVLTKARSKHEAFKKDFFGDSN